MTEASTAASARVTARGASLQRSRETETDATGYFRLRDLPVGTYDVRLAFVGYRPVRFERVEVLLGRTTSLGETRLEAQVLELDEIVVNSIRPLVDVSSAATVTNLTSEQFSDLPTDRNFRSIVSLAPQANASQFPREAVNISGSTGPENAYFLDGVNITTPRLGASSSSLPYNFVRELQVKTGGYEAEFGRATGGIVDVITHSGGNRFGGQVFGFFTDDGLTAEPRLALQNARESEFSGYDIGGSLGGPILRDRLWFFAAYDPKFDRQRVDVRGPELPDDRTTEHVFAAKLTWQAGPRTDVVLTAHGGPRRHLGVDLGLARDSVTDIDAVRFLERFNILVLSAIVRQRLTGAVQAELGVTRLSVDGRFEDAAGRTDPNFFDATTGVVSGGYGSKTHSHNVRSAVRGSTTAVFGPHTMKVGVEYEDVHNRQQLDASAEPGSPQGYITRRTETIYRWERLQFGGQVRNRVVTGFGQDAWRLGTRMLLNFGMRWDAQYLIAEGKLAQRFTDQWQPRVGFVYQVGVPGTQKLFGSYGRFYEQIPLQLPIVLYNPGRAVTLRYDHDPRIDASGADTVDEFSSTASDFPPSRDLRGQSLDEFTLGYERALGQFRMGVRGIYRTLNWALEDGFDSVTENVELGNPGRGNLYTVPRARRTYHALAFTFEKPVGRLNFRASYVLSRSWGNYEGLSQAGDPSPNLTGAFDAPERYPNSTGRLPNDKPHVFKFSGSYRFDFGLSAGTAIALMSGEPRNEFGVLSSGDPGVFLQPRGSAGRTAAVLDASVRLTYALRSWLGGALRPRVYLDLFHLGNRRTALDFDELHYLEVSADGAPTTPNPSYGRPLLFQPPMSARIGLSVDFGAFE